jgi:hypothetical protein
MGLAIYCADWYHIELPDQGSQCLLVGNTKGGTTCNEINKHVHMPFNCCS